MKPGAEGVGIDDDHVDVVRGGRDQVERVVGVGRRADTARHPLLSGLETLTRRRLAREHDLDLARLGRRASAGPTSVSPIVRLTVSVPERAIHVSLYVPGRRTFAGRRSLTTFAPALT